MRTDTKSIFSTKLESKARGLVGGITKLLEAAHKGDCKEDLLDPLALIQDSVNEIVSEVEDLPGVRGLFLFFSFFSFLFFTFFLSFFHLLHLLLLLPQFTLIKRRGSNAEQFSPEEETMQHLPPIMSDMVKAIRRLVEEVNSGCAASEDYMEATYLIGNLGQQLLSQVPDSDSSDHFSNKLKKLIVTTKVASGVWCPPEALSDLTAAAFDLAIALKSLRDHLESARDDGSVRSPSLRGEQFLTAKERAIMKADGKKAGSNREIGAPEGSSKIEREGVRGLVRASSSSELKEETSRMGFGVARSMSSMSLSKTQAQKPGNFASTDILDDYMAPQSVGDGVTQDVLSSLSSLLLAVRVHANSTNSTSAENVKVAAQSLAKATKILISSAMAFQVRPLSPVSTSFNKSNIHFLLFHSCTARREPRSMERGRSSIMRLPHSLRRKSSLPSPSAMENSHLTSTRLSLRMGRFCPRKRQCQMKSSWRS